MLIFDEDHASKYGLKEAVVLHKIIFYVLLNEKDGRNIHLGKHWTFNSREGWQNVFKCFSYEQVWRSLKALEKKGALVSDSFNRRAYDKTRWYSLSSSLAKEVKGSEYWQKAIRNSVKPNYKTAITNRKTATPIPLDNNIITTNPY
jgi:hypothetical protein